MNKIIGWMGLALGGAALTGCQSDTPIEGPTGSVEFEIAASTYVPIAKATYEVTIEVLGQDGKYRPFQEFTATSSDTAEVANEEWKATTIGSCLASDDGTPVTHRATIKLVEVLDDKGVSAIEGCEGETEQVRYFDCENGGDTRVASEFHFMCEVARGFSDVTFKVDDAYCKAKIDCPEQPLLYNPKTGQREKTLVIGAQCSPNLSGGLDFEVPIFAQLTCQDATGKIFDQVTRLGPDMTKNPMFYAEEYNLNEAIDDIRTHNFAVALNASAFDGAKSCRLEFATLPVPYDAEGKFAKQELRRDAMVVLGAVDLVIEKDQVACKGIVVKPGTLPVLALQDQTKENGVRQLVATSLSLPSLKEPYLEPGCFEKARDGEGGWAEDRADALDADQTIRELNVDIADLNARLDAINAQYEIDINTYKGRQSTLTTDVDALERPTANIVNTVDKYFQNQMAVTGANLCDLYSDLGTAFDNDEVDRVEVLATLTQIRTTGALRLAGNAFTALIPTINAAVAVYARVAAEYDLDGLDLAGRLEATRAGIADFAQFSASIERTLGTDANADVATALDDLVANCAVLSNTAADLRTAANDTYDNPAGALVDLNNAIQGLNDANDDVNDPDNELGEDNVAYQIKIVEADKDDATDAFNIALQGFNGKYEAMSDGETACASRDFALRVTEGLATFDGTADINNTSSFYFASEADVSEPEIADACLINAVADGQRTEKISGMSIAFSAKDAFHSIELSIGSKGYGLGQYNIVAAEGDFAFDAIGRKIFPECGPSFTGSADFAQPLSE